MRTDGTHFMVSVKIGTVGSAALSIERKPGEQVQFVQKRFGAVGKRPKVDGVVDLYTRLAQVPFAARLSKCLPDTMKDPGSAPHPRYLDFERNIDIHIRS